MTFPTIDMLRKWANAPSSNVFVPIHPTTLRALADAMEAVRAIVDEQAKDEGLWFTAQCASEAYLQAALRRLHAAIESKVA